MVVFCGCFEPVFHDDEIVQNELLVSSPKNGESAKSSGSEDMKVPEEMRPDGSETVRSNDGFETNDVTIPAGFSPREQYEIMKIDAHGPQTSSFGCVDTLEEMVTPRPAYDQQREQPTETKEVDSPLAAAFSEVMQEIFSPEATTKNEPNGAFFPAASISPVGSDTNPISLIPKQKVMLVRVPTGIPAGTTMQVEVPGENRALAVTVPSGVDSFHVAYTPQLIPSEPKISNKKKSPVHYYPPTPMPPPPQSDSRIASRTIPIGQKLLLVRVPPGTTSGTTLHVSVPDEPGRILAAIVPPGNVKEFHVAYEARAKQESNHQSYIAPASAYQTNNNQVSERPSKYTPREEEHSHLPPSRISYPSNSNLYDRYVSANNMDSFSVDRDESYYKQ